MTRYAGSSLIISWIQASATTILSSDYRTLDYTPSIDFIDQSAGADTAKTYISSLTDGQLSMSFLVGAGATGVGTAPIAALAEGNLGTIKWSPEGTASTKIYSQIPAYSQGVKLSYPYAGVVEATVSFQQNGARASGTN
jgi:hypothetical protein